MEEPQVSIQNLVSGALLELRTQSPFFATLALFARITPTETLPTAATDGRDIFVNPDFLRGLTRSQRAGLLLHELLHAALLHIPRRGLRQPRAWNVAADIVVNGMIAKQKTVDLPPGALRDTETENLSVEEVYQRLLSDPDKKPLLDAADAFFDLIEEPSGVYGAANRQKIEAHWRQAMEQAKIMARSTQFGTLPVGMTRELGMINPAQIDWRSYLWRFLARTPTDFQGFDRRFIGRGLYLEALDGESVHVYVAIDTSGSIDNQVLNTFLSEVQGILRSYPHLLCDLYYADAEAHGPFPLTAHGDIPPPIGGGGTNFIPFFTAVERDSTMAEEGVCVYLTDGYGTFPPEPPLMPTLWVVTSGGLALEDFPFGESVRLLDDV